MISLAQCLLTPEPKASVQIFDRKKANGTGVNRKSPFMPTMGECTSHVKGTYRFMCHPAGQLVSPCAKHELTLTLQQSTLFI